MLRFESLFLQEDKRALLVCGNNVHFPIAINIADDDVISGTAVIVDLVGYEFDLAIGSARLPEPIENGRMGGLWITISMDPESLASDDVLQTIAVDIRPFDRLHSCEGNTIFVVALAVYDEVALELVNRPGFVGGLGV